MVDVTIFSVSSLSSMQSVLAFNKAASLFAASQQLLNDMRGLFMAKDIEPLDGRKRESKTREAR
jgi:hypothetical protein